jgi:hypothetical protein
METNTLDLKTATDQQLKAFAYDCLIGIEQNQASLKAINAELELRLKESKKPEQESTLCR